MDSLSLEEKNIIKEIRNLFRIKKELNYTAVKGITNFYRLGKETKKAIKDRAFRDIKNLFEFEEEHYFKPGRVNNFWSNNYIEYKCNNDKNKTLSAEECLNKIRPYLKRHYK